MRAKATVLVLCSILAAAAAGAEQERILSFHSDIAIGADDSLTITETIRLVSTGDKIKRGFLRDFPVVLRDGARRKIYGFEVQGVLRDGKKEPYVVDPLARPDYARIKIGSPDVLLPPGEHTYAITYRTTKHIRFFPDHDELYFNVNGTEWVFPFDKVAATVTLPKGAKLFKDLVNGYTGAEGQKGKDYAAKRLPDGRIFFETTRPLKVGENLTIVVALDKGAVKEPPPPPAERIPDFHSDIGIGADGSLTVTETIRLVAAGEKIDQGIRRDFRVALRDLLQRKTFGLKVLKVLRDGKEEPYRVSMDKLPDHARLETGSYGTTLADGEHTCAITYQTTGHIRFLRDHDELAFDVNGTGLPLPLDKVRATVTLPKGAKLLPDRVTGHTGAGGQAGKDFTWKQLPDGEVVFETTRPFKPGENLAIVVPIAKGAVAEPSAAEKRRAWMSDNLPAVLALGGFAVVLAFLVVAWVLFGRDPAKAVAMPRAEPPTDPESGHVFSPAEVAFVRGMGFDGGCVAPALLDMAIRGYLIIEEKKAEGDMVHTIQLRDGADPSKLAADEQRFAEKVFADNRSSLILKDDDPNLFRGVEAMRDAMEKEWARATFRRRAFLRGLGWTLAGAGAIAAAFCHMLDDPLAYWTLVAVACAPALLLVYCGLKYLVRQWCKLVTRDPKKPSVGGYLFAAVGIGGPSAAAVYGLYWLSHFSTVWVPLGVFGMFLANLELGPFLKRYTRRGRLIMDQADQLALHLTTVGSDPQRPAGPEGFERLLPYAMALGVADRWAHTFLTRFQQATASAATERGGGWSPDDYQPAWYRARMAFSFFEPEWSFYEKMQYSLSRRLPSGKATTTSSSPSRGGWRSSTTGSGARGSSGGGSGGGGGSGW